MPQNLVQPPPISRGAFGRHHPRRSTSSIAPKLEPGMTLPPPGHRMHSASSVTSPKNQPTPSSHSASPTTTASAFGASPAGSGSDPSASTASMRAMARPPLPMKPQAPSQLSPMAGMTQPRPVQPAMPQAAQAGHRMRGGAPANTPFYPTTSFQTHIEQLGKLSRFLSPFSFVNVIELRRPRFIP